MNAIDLHTHSTYSDGTKSPTELIELAHKVSLQAIAITDHDTTAGIPEAMAHGQKMGVEVVSGVEVSADLDGIPMHILGYNFVTEDSLLQKRLRVLQDARHQRNLQIFAKLRELGFPITIDEVPPTPGQVGRPHIARLLISKGIVKNMDQAFTRFLRRGSSAYVQCYRMSAAETITMIHEAGGLAFLAHPTANDRQMKYVPQLLTDLKKLGLDGLELHYPTHTSKTVKTLRRLGDKLGLLYSGGSDFHGDGKPHINIGSNPKGQPTPYELLTAIKNQR
ncbi:MAG: PHP domain-containing protein [Desulfobulbaceae bacterium]|nr:PHP domain-containing protein [Desulfobulbaceae bacterium]